MGQTDVQVQISGISEKKGEIFAALYTSSAGFPSKVTHAFKTAKATPLNGKAVLTFSEVPEGKYAIALFHDTNNDGKLNTNFLGIPKEGYGVSNNVRNLFSAPGFDESSFKVGKSAVKLTIKVQY